MEYLILYRSGRPPEHQVFFDEEDDEIIRKYLCWVQECICRVIRMGEDPHGEPMCWELQDNGEFLEIQREFF